MARATSRRAEWAPSLLDAEHVADRGEGERLEGADGDERPRERRGVDDVVVHLRPHEPRTTKPAVQERLVEADVVPGEHAPLGDRREALERVVDVRGVVPLLRVEAVQRGGLDAAPLGELRTNARRHLPLDEEDLRVNAHRGELDDLVQRGST